MRITLEGIRYFAYSVRVNLQNADVPLRHVLLHRLARSRVPLPASRRRLTTENVQPQPSPPDTFLASSSTSVATTATSGHTSTEHGRKAFADRPTSADVQADNSRPLPLSCPGCGALSQEIESAEAGYYSRSRKAVRGYLRSIRDIGRTNDTSDLVAGEINTSIVGTDAHVAAKDQGAYAPFDTEESLSRRPSAQSAPVPICDRCHDLMYQARGVSIAHPPIDAIADTITASPFRHNHVFHVLDAADFPLSLIPNIYKSLSLAQPRTQNRRSQHDFSRKPTLSFVITRGDLVTKTKEGIDALMPYFTSVLRTALGSFAQDIRLGNVHLVSAKRGWWTRDIKESIWKRGGGNWMVGKVNVGKSNLFEVLFPKGSGERAPSYSELQQENRAMATPLYDFQGDESLPEDSLLPPLQPETPFPVLPLVSILPGTTASPIRLSFGKHKGELIDLPGLVRGNLEDYVHPDHKSDLIMQSRPTVSQCNIKPGQSLLLGGGLVRITPMLDKADPSTIVLAYAFVPIDAHVTATSKAISTQLQERESGIKSILAEGVGSTMASAGTFTLYDDVTKARAAPLLASGVAPDRLPFRVFATDILVEGVGWVELACQVRRRRQPPQTTFPTGPDGDAFSNLENQTTLSSDSSGSFDLPQVEIFTPGGKHVGQRKTMGAWKLWHEACKASGSVRSKRMLHARPRKPMKGTKKREREASGSTQ